MEYKVDVKTFWISIGDDKRAGVIEPGGSLHTMSEIETFTSEIEWKIKVKELGIKDENLMIVKKRELPILNKNR